MVYAVVLTLDLNGEQQEKVMIESVIMHKAAPQGEWTNYEASQVLHRSCSVRLWRQSCDDVSPTDE